MADEYILISIVILPFGIDVLCDVLIVSESQYVKLLQESEIT